MKLNATELKREDILTLAHQAKLMIVDGEVAYLNDMATEKELLAFVRLLEAKTVAPKMHLDKHAHRETGGMASAF
jgi:hypothetical protein